MFSYVFNNGLHDIYVTFWEPWKRFHSHMAATLDHPHAHALVSYASPIALYIERDGFAQLFIADEWNYSTSTIRQFARWLREKTTYTYQDVKEAFRQMEQTQLFKYTNWKNEIEYVSVSNLMPHLIEEFGRESATNWRFDRI